MYPLICKMLPNYGQGAGRGQQVGEAGAGPVGPLVCHFQAGGVSSRSSLRGEAARSRGGEVARVIGSQKGRGGSWEMKRGATMLCPWPRVVWICKGLCARVVICTGLWRTGQVTERASDAADGQMRLRVGRTLGERRRVG